MSDGSCKILACWGSVCSVFSPPGLSFMTSLKALQHQCFVSMAQRVLLCSCLIPTRLAACRWQRLQLLGYMDLLLHHVSSSVGEAGCFAPSLDREWLRWGTTDSSCLYFHCLVHSRDSVSVGWMKKRRAGGSSLLVSRFFRWPASWMLWKTVTAFWKINLWSILWI